MNISKVKNKYVGKWVEFNNRHTPPVIFKVCQAYPYKGIAENKYWLFPGPPRDHCGYREDFCKLLTPEELILYHY